MMADRRQVRVEYSGGSQFILTSDPAPGNVRLVVGLFSLPLFAVGLVSLWNAAVSVLSGALVEKSASNLVVGGVVTLCFILVPLALLSFALFTSGQNLSIDLVAGTATHKRRSLFGTREKVFPIRTVKPELIFYSEDGDSFARYAISVRMPDGSSIEYCPVMLPLNEQRDLCSRQVASIKVAQSGSRG